MAKRSERKRAKLTRGEFVDAIAFERDLKKIWVKEGQKEKIKKAFETNSKYITIRFGLTYLYGEDVIALTKSKVDRLVKAYEEKKGITIRMSKTQLAHNSKIEAGFLPALAGLIPFLTGTILPAFGVGASLGLASSGVQKLIGNGFVSQEGRKCV